MNITRINEFEAAAGKESDLYDFLQSLMPYISSSVGCASCEVLKDNENNNQFI